MEDVDVDVGWPMSIIIPACMHSIEPGLGILSARQGGEGASLSLWRWNGAVPFSYVRSPNLQTPPVPSQPFISGRRSSPHSIICMSPFMPFVNLVVLEVMVGDCRPKRSLWVNLAA